MLSLVAIAVPPVLIAVLLREAVAVPTSVEMAVLLCFAVEVEPL